MKSPESAPSDEVYRLRLTVRDEAVDALLARLTNPAARQLLPGYLFVYSEQTYIHQVDDTFDGYSDKDFKLRSYVRKIDDYNRKTFRAAGGVALEGRRLQLQVGLGIEAAHRILIPPLFQAVGDSRLAVSYEIPGSGAVDSGAVQAIHDQLREQPQNIYDELTVVTQETALRSLYIRSRERKELTH